MLCDCSIWPERDRLNREKAKKINYEQKQISYYLRFHFDRHMQGRIAGGFYRAGAGI